MKTLILYSSCDGQTKKIAEFIASKLSGDVQTQPLTEKTDITKADRIVIGASIRYGHFDKVLDKFVKKQTALLSQKPNAFFAVNLTARKAGKDTPETNVYVRKFLQRIDWQPHLAAVFAGALYYPRYSFFDRTMIRLIMKITGGETDTSKEIEYTDWQKVESFTEQFEKFK
ncbi:TPA: menaquinone-dependent protoporphyrinogen IX dehydrogenase [Pasteurella multocida]|uniref:menaquinone-dependent protoporphyrinogen IX dehydrogenase n=1 Tax=Pasteurella multocida TaxID=747 RepID=UPI002877EA54|nr:menaquinone-dependent protoporphyrinogen IX dehydrogenase [Pasteurella multocida]WND43614.1 menaquinone-dependent protoporphyrinogen IX dehydrogenase [Pasteurella multocida]HDR1866294.1 menaquinone-dependent protoporphyrinogen IX dehydrogenase [Pasteurella multocida]